MLILVLSAATSGWEVATSVGTIGAAAVTLLAVATALWQGARDRKAADDALSKQLKAARDARQRDHQIGLLLSLSQQVVSVSLATSGTPEMRRERLRGLALLQALPDAGQTIPRAVEVLSGDQERIRDSTEPALREIAERVATVAKS